MSSISFELHKLGWKAFQDLVGHIFDEVMGQTFQQFADGPDGGRDGVYYGQWIPQDGEVLSGNFTIQCKHTSKLSQVLPDSVIDNELPKIKRLSQNGLVDNYIFVTNHTLTGEKERNAHRYFTDAGAKNVRIFGAGWINKKIAKYPQLRRLVPRLYGLGDLTEIVTHQAYRQARAVLDDFMPDLQCFVSTRAYKKSAHALSKQGFVLLVGEPGSGKTTIANLLALAAADEWGLQTLILSGPEDLSHLFNPDDPGQFLWVDDAFGTTQYDPMRVQEWNQRLPILRAAINKGARVVFTSRDYIFNAAKNDLKSRFIDLFGDNLIIIKVEELSENERQMILYNHLKCGDQPHIFRKIVKPWLLEAAATRRFLPEIARRFANPKFTKDLSLTQKGMKDFFENPVDFLQTTLSNFSPSEKAALALVFIADGRLLVPIPDDEKTLQTIATMQSSIGAVKASLNALNNALIRRHKDNGREYWCFQHPTIRDAFGSLVAANPELIDIYLAGTPTEKLMNEVTCGDVSLEGVKIIVPPEKYWVVLEKLKEAGRNHTSYFDPVTPFLAHKCSSDFLEKYFTECESMELLPSQIRYIESSDKASKMLTRLHIDGRLPDEIRQATMEQIYSLAKSEYSYVFANTPIVDLMTEDEINTLKVHIKDVILSKGYDLIYEMSQDWDPKGDVEPIDFFSEYEDTLRSIFDETEDEKERSKANELMDDLSYIVQEMEREKDSAEQSAQYNSIYDYPDEEYRATRWMRSGRNTSKPFSSGGVKSLAAKLRLDIPPPGTTADKNDSASYTVFDGSNRSITRLQSSPSRLPVARHQSGLTSTP